MYEEVTIFLIDLAGYLMLLYLFYGLSCLWTFLSSFVPHFYTCMASGCNNEVRVLQPEYMYVIRANTQASPQTVPTEYGGHVGYSGLYMTWTVD